MSIVPGINIQEKWMNAIEAIASSGSDSFTTLLSISGLNPAFDLEGCDFSGVDFSNTDLRGFNLSGCNLSGAYGVNVLVDPSTKLDGARCVDGIFQHIFDKRLFLNDDFTQKVLAQVTGFDSLSRSEWIMGHFDADRYEPDFRRKLCLELFDKEESQFVRNNFLATAHKIFRGKNEYRNYLLDKVSASGRDGDRLFAFNTLAKYYNEDELTRQVFISAFLHFDYRYQFTALLALCASRAALLNDLNNIQTIFFSSGMRKFRRELLERSCLSERLYLLSAIFSPAFQLLASHHDIKIISADFADSVDEISLRNTIGLVQALSVEIATGQTFENFYRTLSTSRISDIDQISNDALKLNGSFATHTSGSRDGWRPIILRLADELSRLLEKSGIEYGFSRAARLTIQPNERRKVVVRDRQSELIKPIFGSMETESLFV
ncbi:MAG: pentapeptide repeat-containing protein [Alteromonadaceae bacterium]|nr:pentapeptide repeat-containing protein [Alteromonadaceae bacterium]